jgi:predicted RNA-binding Zn ribbon-like protein
MDLNERPAGQMKLVGGRLCLDFVNTVGGRRPGAARKKSDRPAVMIRADKLTHYVDLLAWSWHTGLLSKTETQALARESKRREKEAVAVLNRAIELREAIYHLCRAVVADEQPDTSDLEVLNREIDTARSHEWLVSAKGNFTWQWDQSKAALDRLLWPVADSAAELLTTGDLTRLHQCGGEDCGWLFVDTSRNRSRQWCDMRDCGNVAKVRRFRQRQDPARPISQRGHDS